MNSIRPEVSQIIRDHGPKLLAHMKSKQKERGVSNTEIVNLAGIPQSSFYRLWNGDGVKMDQDHVARICLFLGISIDDFMRDPSEDSTAKLAIPKASHEDVMTNIHEEIGRLKHTIEELQNDIAEKDALIVSLKASLKEKTDELIALHAGYVEKLDKMKDALIERHDQMHEMSNQHNRRVDEMNKELKRRYDHLYSFFGKLVGEHPEIVLDLINEVTKNIGK